MILNEIYFTCFPLAGHFQNPTGHFWPAGMGLDGPVLRDQSMILSCLFAQREIQRRSLDEIAEEQVRRGQIRRSCLDEI